MWEGQDGPGRQTSDQGCRTGSGFLLYSLHLWLPLHTAEPIVPPSPLPTFYSMPLPSAQGTSLVSPLSLLSQSSWSTDASTVLDSWPGA